MSDLIRNPDDSKILNTVLFLIHIFHDSFAFVQFSNHNIRMSEVKVHCYIEVLRTSFHSKNEPSLEKTNNVVSKQVRHKSVCAVTETG